MNKGFRLIAHNGVIRWSRSAEVPARAIDCTDMSDEEFDAKVCRIVGETSATYQSENEYQLSKKEDWA